MRNGLKKIHLDHIRMIVNNDDNDDNDEKVSDTEYLRIHLKNLENNY